MPGEILQMPACGYRRSGTSVSDTCRTLAGCELRSEPVPIWRVHVPAPPVSKPRPAEAGAVLVVMHGSGRPISRI